MSWIVKPKNLNLMPIQKPKNINFRASEELYQTLQAEATRTHRSVGAFVRAILEMVLMPDPNDAEVERP
jgi:plasmid stability protein